MKPIGKKNILIEDRSLSVNVSAGPEDQVIAHMMLNNIRWKRTLWRWEEMTQEDLKRELGEMFSEVFCEICKQKNLFPELTEPTE